MACVTLTWPEFIQEATEFMQKANILGDDWQLHQQDDEPGNSFLLFKQKISARSSTTPTDLNTELIQVEYHVAYSISYQVPMLYFRAQRQDGSSLRLEDAWCIFHTPQMDQSMTRSRTDMLSILTQMDHPVLNKPYLALHPCRTAELLGQAGTSQNRVLTFISLMGPFVQLNLRNEYGLSTSYDG